MVVFITKWGNVNVDTMANLHRPERIAIDSKDNVYPS